MLELLVLGFNRLANALGAVVLSPIAWLPGWLSATLIAVATGIAMLYIFKHTSNQTAIKRTRARINANTLALSLFKDNIWVTLRCQTRLLAGAVMLMVHALIPMAVMTIPMVLVLSQLALWYQVRPLRVGEAAIVTVQLADSATQSTLDGMQLKMSEPVEVVNGPVRVTTKKMIVWDIRATQPGKHQLSFVDGGQTFDKELVADDGFRITSIKRPPMSASDMLLHPYEPPFGADSAVQSIHVSYPKRESWTCGTDSWLIYWFLMSMLAAFAVKPLLKVNI